MSALDGETFWEVQAKTVWGQYISEVEKRLILIAHELSDSPTLALEVGCEGGRWTKLLTELGWSMICTDVDSNTLAKCQSKVPAARCILTNGADVSLPIKTPSVNLLLCIEVFPVMPEAWFVQEAARVLQSGGYMVGVFNNIRSVRGILHHLWARAAKKPDYYRSAYGPWKKRAMTYGFEVIAEEGLCWFPFGRGSQSRLAGSFIWLERFIGLRSLASLSPWVVFVARKT